LEFDFRISDTYRYIPLSNVCAIAFYAFAILNPVETFAKTPKQGQFLVKSKHTHTQIDCK